MEEGRRNGESGGSEIKNKRPIDNKKLNKSPLLYALEMKWSHNLVSLKKKRIKDPGRMPLFLTLKMSKMEQKLRNVSGPPKPERKGNRFHLLP